MALLKGKQIATGADGVNTANIVDGALAASAAGRAKMATSFFDNTTTVSSKFSAGSIGLDRLEEAVVQADGGQAFTGNQSMGSNKLTNLANGTDAGDAVNKSQLDSAVAGLSWKDAVKCATTANDLGSGGAVTYDNGTAGVGATLTSDTNEAIPSQDGISLSVGERLLVKNQTAGAENGIYEVTDAGSGATPWIITRVTDADISTELDGAAVFAQQGTAHGDTGWTQTADAPTIGTTSLTWSQFTGTAGITFGTPGAIQPDDAAAEGSSSNAARADHTHSIVAAAAGTIQPDDVAAEGSATSFSRSDHVHAIVAAAPAANLSATTSNAEGSATSFARSDHSHAITANVAPGTIQPDDAAAVGTSAAVARADHTHAIVAAAAGAVAIGDAAAEGSATSFARSDHTHSVAAGTPGGLGAANAEGSASTFARSDHTHARDTANQEQITTEAITGTDTVLADTLNATPLSAANFSLYLNGMLQQEGAGNDYTRSGTAITWLASTGTAVDMETSDELIAIYDS